MVFLVRQMSYGHPLPSRDLEDSENNALYPARRRESTERRFTGESEFDSAEIATRAEPESGSLNFVHYQLARSPQQSLTALPSPPVRDSVDCLKSLFRMKNPSATKQAAATTEATKARDETLRWGRFICWAMKMKQNHAHMNQTWTNSISVCVLDAASNLLRPRS